MGKKNHNASPDTKQDDAGDFATENFNQLLEPATLERVEHILKEMFPQGLTRKADEIAAQDRLLRTNLHWHYALVLVVIALIAIGIGVFKSDADMVKLFLVGGLAFLGGTAISPSFRDAGRSRQ